MAHEVVGCVPVRGEEVHDALRQADRVGRLGDDVGLQRRLRRGLHDRGAAGEKGWRQLAGHDPEGIVPRGDQGGDTRRLAHHQGPALSVERRAPGLERITRGEIGVVVEPEPAAARHHRRHSRQCAGLIGPGAGDLRHARLQRRGQLPQPLGPFGGFQTRPGALVERLARGGHRSVDIRLAGFRDDRDHLLVVRRDHLDARGGGAVDPAAIDVELVRMGDIDGREHGHCGLFGDVLSVSVSRPGGFWRTAPQRLSTPRPGRPVRRRRSPGSGCAWPGRRSGRSG